MDKKLCRQCSKYYPATTEYFKSHWVGDFGVGSICKDCRDGKTDKIPNGSEPFIYIYTLVDPESGDPFYVGQTTNMNARLQIHIATPNKGNKAKFSSLKERGYGPAIKQIDVCPIEDEALADAKEEYWIDKLKSDGYTLTNVTRRNNVSKRIAKAKILHSPEEVREIAANIEHKIKSITNETHNLMLDSQDVNGVNSFISIELVHINRLLKALVNQIEARQSEH